MRSLFFKIGILLLFSQCVKETPSESTQTFTSMIISSMDGDLTIACAGKQQYVVGLQNLNKNKNHCGLNLHLRDVADIRKIVKRSNALEVTCSNGVSENIPEKSYENDNYCKQPNVDLAVKIGTKYNEMKEIFFNEYITNHAFTLDSAGCQKIGKNISDLTLRYQMYKACSKSLEPYEITYSKFLKTKEVAKNQNKKIGTEILVTFAIENMKYLETETILEIVNSASDVDKDRVLSSYTALFVFNLSYSEIESFGKLMSKTAADKMYVLVLEYKSRQLTAVEKKSIISMISNSQIRKNAERIL